MQVCYRLPEVTK